MRIHLRHAGTTDDRPDVSQDMAPFRRMVLLCVLAAATILLLPDDLKGLAFSVFGATTAAALFRRLRRLPLNVRRPVRLLAVAGALSITAGIVRGLHASFSGTPYPFPSPADPIYLTDYVLFIAAILYIVRLRVRRVSADAALDALVGLLAAGLLQWTLVLIPYVRSDGSAPLQQAANLTFSTLALFMVGAAVLALVAGSIPTVSNRLLALGLIATFATDITAVMVSSGKLPPNTETYPAFLVIVFAGTGLFHPSVVRLVDQPQGEQLRRRLTRRRVSVLALALLTPPLLMLFAALELGADALVLLPAVISLALTPVVVTRLGRLVRQNEEMAALEAGLRAVGEQLVSAESERQVASIIARGAEQLIGTSGITSALVLDPGDPDAVARHPDLAAPIRSMATLLMEGTPDAASLLALPTGEGERFTTAGLVVAQQGVAAALVLVTDQPLTDDQGNAVRALCRETAIALRAVEQTERQVRQRSEDRFAALIDNSSDIVAVLGAQQQVMYISPVARRLLGYQLDALDQVDVLDLVHPDEAETAAAMLEELRGGVSDSVELRLRHHDGSFRWFEVVGVDLSEDPNIGGLLLNLREVSDRKQAEEQLLLSEARFKALVQHSTDLVVVLTSSGVVRYASPSVGQALGVEPERLLGRHIAEVFRDADVDWEHQLGDDAPSSRGAPVLFEFTFRRGPEDRRVVETSLTDLRREPAVGGFVLNARDVTERKGMEQRLRYQATHDELTGLVNRAQALEDLDRMLGRNSGSTTVGAVLVGLDDFKDVNDSLGHGVGDRLLVAVAERITGLLDFGDVAARVAGDQFAVVLERAHGENQVTDLAEQILSAIALPYDLEGRELRVTASAGIVFDHDRTNAGDILLRNADTAMYRAKAQGKRQVVVFESYMHTASFDRMELRADLARAIAEEQFVAHYQPVVDIETHRIVGAEALIRWEHPERGLVGPGLFIPLAEDSGMIGALGEWMLERACTDLAGWRQDLGPEMDAFSVSVNLSVQQLHDDLIVDTVRSILATAGLPADRLVLEVTESTLITETDRVRSTMQQLRSLGARLAIDDFGTGYSSLGYIQQFDFDVLKIDKSFVDGLENGTSRQIVTAVLELAGQLGVRTVAEGIETRSQDLLLRELGCKLGQGYLYSRPVPEVEFLELLAAERSAGMLST